MKRFVVAAAVAALVAGCGNSEIVPFLGRWKAAFAVDGIAGGGSAKDMARESLHGYLQVYATNRSYKLHLEGEQEAIDADGVWTQTKDRLTLRVTTLKIDDEGGAALRNPNMKFILPTDIRSAYSHKIDVRLSKDKKTLMGLETSIGNLQGKHIFIRSND